MDRIISVFFLVSPFDSLRLSELSEEHFPFGLCDIPLRVLLLNQNLVHPVQFLLFSLRPLRLCGKFRF
jgi:hypothetical protein